MEIGRVFWAILIGIGVAIVFSLPDQTRNYSVLLGVLAGVGYFFSGLGKA